MDGADPVPGLEAEPVGDAHARLRDPAGARGQRPEQLSKLLGADREASPGAGAGLAQLGPEDRWSLVPAELPVDPPDALLAAGDPGDERVAGIGSEHLQRNRWHGERERSPGFLPGVLEAVRLAPDGHLAKGQREKLEG